MSLPAIICVVGSSNIDLISKVPRLPKLGETMVGHSFHLGYGGKGANQAVMAAKLGARVTMVTKLGRDVFGQGTLDNYRAQGVDTTFVLFEESQASGVAPIFVNDAANNFIVIIPGANYALSPADAQTASDVIHAADALVCQLKIPIETTLEAFRIAHAAHIPTILNPAPAVPLPDELLQLTDICIPNETEIELLTGSPVRSLEQVEGAARKVLARGVRVVIVTLGERGALVVEQDAVEQVAPIAIDAVDPTGAGDAFIGSLAVFLGEGLALRDAARRANAIAARTVTQIGTQSSFPNRAEADDFCARYGIGL